MLKNIQLFSIFVLLFISTLYFGGIWSYSSPDKVVTPKLSALSAQAAPLDSKYSEQKNSLRNINLESAWDLTTGSNEIIVAIIDDAIDINHPDLRANMMAGYDFVNEDTDPSPGLCVDPAKQTETLEQHGTKVAGIIGAVGNNNLGIAGINWQIKIMPLKIGCYYKQSLETRAVQYALDNGAHIINASYGGPDFLTRNPAVIDLLKNTNKDVLFVTAAGNYHGNNDEMPVYPGSIGLQNVLTVSASDANNLHAEWTQFGATTVDLSAPGLDLLSTFSGNSFGGDYESASGSSFSTAVVSGVAALLKSYDFNDTLSALDVKAVLQASVTPVAGQIAKNKASGQVNAKAALDLLNSPQPVLTIINAKYSDDGAIFTNNLIDTNENGTITLELENLWSDILNGTVSVSVENPIVQIPTSFFNLSSMSAGERRNLIIPIETNSFNGHHRIRFHLDINLIGAAKSVSYKRSFEIQTGVLNNNQQFNGRIQQTNTDDYQYFHLNVPSNMDRVAVELDYDVLDARDMGLLAGFDKRPLIHFRHYNGSAYSYSAEKISDLKTGFERIDFRLAGTTDSTLNIMVFNTPSSDLSKDFQINKPFKVKSCFYSDSDGNSPPKVFAGLDREVNAGDTIVLTAVVNDSDGDITKSYWVSDTGADFIVLNDTEIQFTAPTSGSYPFSFVAIDNGCKKVVDGVTISVNDVNGNEPDGLILNPRTLSIDENSGFDVLVSGFYNLKEVSTLTMTSAPDGVVYANGKVSWTNASPVGIHLIKFTAIVDSEVLFGTITVEIGQRKVGNGGAGCVAMKNAQFDPLFLIYIFFSFLFIHKKSVLRIKTT